MSAANPQSSEVGKPSCESKLRAWLHLIWGRKGMGRPYQWASRAECNRDRARLFSVVASNRTTSDGHQPKYRKFILTTKLHLYSRDDWHRSTLPTVTLHPCSYSSPARLGPGQPPLADHALSMGLDCSPSEVPSNLNYCTIYFLHHRIRKCE